MYIIWMKYISWYYYGNEALMINQWKDVEKIECGDSLLCPPNGDAAIAILNFDKVHLIAYLPLHKSH